MYREKYGPFNQSLRTDAALARAICAIRGGKMAEFMPWPKEPEPVASIESVFGMLQSASANNRKKK